MIPSPLQRRERAVDGEYPLEGARTLRAEAVSVEAVCVCVCVCVDEEEGGTRGTGRNM